MICQLCCKPNFWTKEHTHIQWMSVIVPSKSVSHHPSQQVHIYVSTTPHIMNHKVAYIYSQTWYSIIIISSRSGKDEYDLSVYFPKTNIIYFHVVHGGFSWIFHIWGYQLLNSYDFFCTSPQWMLPVLRRCACFLPIRKGGSEPAGYPAGRIQQKRRFWGCENTIVFR